MPLLYTAAITIMTKENPTSAMTLEIYSNTTRNKPSATQLNT